MILMTAVKQFVRDYADDTISALIVKAVTLLTFATGLITESSVLEMLGASAMGSVMMGYAFAAMNGPQEKVALRRKWAVNLCMGIPAGLFAAYKYKYLFPEVPGWVISGLFSGLAGQASVGVIIIVKPYVAPLINAYAAKKVKWATKILGLDEKPNAPNTATDSGYQDAKGRNQGGEQSGAPQDKGVHGDSAWNILPVEREDGGNRRD